MLSLVNKGHDWSRGMSVVTIGSYVVGAFEVDARVTTFVEFLVT
jgi:hypothetical protein